MARPSGGGGRPSGGHSSSRVSGGHRVGSGRPSGSSSSSSGGFGNSFNSSHSSFGSFGSNDRRSSGPDLGDMLLGSMIASRGRDLARSLECEREKERQHEREMERIRSQNRSQESSYEGQNESYYAGNLGFGGSPPNLNNSMGYPSTGGEDSSKKSKTLLERVSLALLLIGTMILALNILLGGIQFLARDDAKVAKDPLTGTSFTSECIIDNDGWFSSTNSLAKSLKKDFFNKTGVQPFIVINNYMPELTTDEEKSEYANQWYTDNISNEYTFLYMYFPEADPYDVGYMCYVNGKQVTSVLDSGVISYFWDTLDRYWDVYSDTDEMIEELFRDTATYATTDGATWKRTMLTGIKSFIFCAIVAVILLIINNRRVRAIEKAQETERILNADISSMADDIANKYK